MTTVVLLAGSLAACHPRTRAEPSVEDNDEDVISMPLATNASDAAPPPAMPPCVLGTTRWLAHGGASAVPTLEGGSLVHGPAGDWLGWVDRLGPGALFIAPPSGEPLRDALGPGENEAPVLAPSNSGVVAVSVVERAGGRVHRVLAVSSAGVRPLFQQREALDDGVSIAAGASPQGVLVAWDEDRANKGAAILSQFVPHSAVARGAPVVPPPPPRALSPDDQDAADPYVLALPDGSMLLAWLAARDDQDPEGEGNVTASDIFVRRLDAAGTPIGQPVAVTPGPGRRFGITAAAGPSGAIWLAYRAAGDADQESRGDGGSVAVLKLGPDLRPVTSAVFANEPGAAVSGVPTLVPAGDGVEVFWTEHAAEGTRTLRRLLRGNAVPAAPAQIEPALAGDVPAYGDDSAVGVVVHGPQGDLGLATGRCPTTLAPPPSAAGPAPRDASAPTRPAAATAH